MAGLKVPNDSVLVTISDCAGRRRTATLSKKAPDTVKTIAPRHPDRRFGPPFGVSIDGTWFGEPTGGAGSWGPPDSFHPSPTNSPSTSSASKSATRPLPTNSSLSTYTSSNSVSSSSPSSSVIITNTPSSSSTPIPAVSHASHSQAKIIAPVCAIGVAVLIGSILVWLYVRRRRTAATRSAESSIQPFSSTHPSHSIPVNSKFRITPMHSRSSTTLPTARAQQLESQLITVRHQLQALEAAIRIPGTQIPHGNSPDGLPDLEIGLDRPPDYVSATLQGDPTRAVSPSNST